MSKKDKTARPEDVPVDIGWVRCPFREQTISIELCFADNKIRNRDYCVPCKYDWMEQIPDDAMQKCWRCGSLVVLTRSVKCPSCRKRIVYQ